jgi:uncharacterized protein
MDVSVRINVDIHNASLAYELLDLFRAKGFFHGDHGFYPYIARVSPINLCKLPPCGVLETSDFYRKSLAFQQRVFQYSGRKQLEPILDFPWAVNSACGALCRNTYGIDPEGFYFKCGLEIGENEKRCGHVKDAVPWQACQKWSDFDPLADEECLKCRYLPFCMGGCPKVQFDHSLDCSKDGCAYWKSSLKGVIRAYVEAKSEMLDGPST